MGAEKRINKKDIGNSTPFVASYYKVFRVFEENKIAMENRTIAKLAGITERLAREQRRLLLDRGIITRIKCRCGNYPMYHLTEYNIKSKNRSLKQLSLPDKRILNEDAVIGAFKKYKKGITNDEVARVTGVKPRRVREETQKLKARGMLKEESCECSHKTPFYYPTQKITKQTDKRHVDLRRKK